MDKKYRLLLILIASLLVLSVLDLITTHTALQAGAEEVNLFIDWLITKHGWLIASAVKISITMFACGLIWIARRRPTIIRTAIFCNILVGVAVANNLFVKIYLQ